MSEPTWIDDVEFRQELVPVIAQDEFSGEIRMLAYANREALIATQKKGTAHFYSRSRAKLWEKGETSGNLLRVSEIWLDCDGDAVIYRVDPLGPTCHTGTHSCFFRRLSPAESPEDSAGARPGPSLLRLQAELEARKTSHGEASYTRSLLDKGAQKISEKVLEEANEFVEALVNESDDRLVSEAADVLYHLMVGLLSRGVPFREVERELSRRAGVSGHLEKASRAEED